MLEQCAMLLASPQRRSTQLQTGDAMDQKKTFLSPKLGWTLEELARSLSVSVPFLRLEVKRGRLRAAHLGVVRTSTVTSFLFIESVWPAATGRRGCGM